MELHADIPFNGSNVEDKIVELMETKLDKTEALTIYGGSYVTEPAYLTRNKAEVAMGNR